MSQGNYSEGRVESFKAAADLSAKQFCAVLLSAQDTVNIASGSNDGNIGILKNKPGAAGRAAAVQTEGVSKAIMSGTVAIGQPLVPTTGGFLIASATDGDYYVARSRVAHTADGATFIGTVDIVRGQFST